MRPLTEPHTLDDVHVGHECVRANEVRFRAVLTRI